MPRIHIVRGIFVFLERMYVFEWSAYLSLMASQHLIGLHLDLQKRILVFMSPSKKKILYPLIALIVGAVVVGGLMASKKAPGKKKQDNKKHYVLTEILMPAPMTLKVASQGVVGARHQTTLVTEVSGKLIEVSEAFARGGRVKVGQVLAKIDPFDYKVKLQQAKANLAAARASYVLERAQGKVAEAEWKQISAATPTELGLRKPQQEQALAAVQAADAALSQAQKNLERTHITAPFDAIILQRDVSLGSYVNIGARLGELADTRVAEVRLALRQSEFNQLDLTSGSLIGTPIGLSAFVAGEAHRWQARIIRQEGFIDTQTHMVYVTAQVDAPYEVNPQVSLAFGLFVQAEIQGKTLQQAVSVPRHLIRDSSLPLLIENTLALRKIDVAYYKQKNAIIVEGIQSGDELIVSALDTPIDGMKLYRLSDRDKVGRIKSDEIPKEISDVNNAQVKGNAR